MNDHEHLKQSSTYGLCYLTYLPRTRFLHAGFSEAIPPPCSGLQILGIFRHICSYNTGRVTTLLARLIPIYSLSGTSMAAISFIATCPIETRSSPPSLCSLSLVQLVSRDGVLQTLSTSVRYFEKDPRTNYKN